MIRGLGEDLKPLSRDPQDGLVLTQSAVKKIIPADQFPQQKFLGKTTPASLRPTMIGKTGLFLKI